jgi:hypothetical protein
LKEETSTFQNTLFLIPKNLIISGNPRQFATYLYCCLPATVTVTAVGDVAYTDRLFAAPETASALLQNFFSKVVTTLGPFTQV